MPATTHEALTAAHNISGYPPGYCLRWCREQWRVDSLYGSAIEAWDGARHKHPGDRNPPDGAPTFYRGGQYGHIVLTCQDTHPGMRSTDCPYTGTVSDAGIDWVERHWGYTYLGWTEDLNGVRLPLGDKEDEDVGYSNWSDDDREALARDVAAAVWTDKMEVTPPAGGKDTKSTKQVLREVWQRIAKAT